MNVGIDKISFFVPPYYVDMTDLALAREVDPNKFHIGIGQDKMAVNKKTQDIVTFAANAAKNILTEEDQAQIDMVIVGTESGIDESKASAVVLHRLLGIQPFARAFEIKEACYAGTAALQFALAHIQRHPKSKVLVVASDIAKYGLASGGEPTQGAGAVAMLISTNPRILELNDDSVALTQDIYDFWRPVGHDYPMVDGQLSNETYIEAFQKVWDEYQERHKKTIKDFQALAFHIPYTKMGKKALLAALEAESSKEQERILTKYEASITYSRQVGNLYTGSLYLGLISLLENGQLNAGDEIGLFSYGSGAVAEFFSGKLVEGYEEYLLTDLHQKQLDERQILSISEYEEMFNDHLDINLDQDYEDSLLYSIVSVSNTVRFYREK
ncbi:hydroxymethylglutaryl-CoA synthase [Enterococcus ureilyticus]|uniref:Hydroxymethylglutaryl-CoA synthase n=1 Tax=Enterococcus ureilyticus TaxID=1131292 RepID=A0A1E5H810_9ENTE|nr:hydroxymethylglutaryl-CoA synthase [Enterococcus ureilyticus]MBM7688780.1 hydroxymethylglutaryl-CoA synthase [Enterococcus ureilyticus]MBO0447291.1 hydroxymethylglutaryl-CoA synthase [Enterococcus ureilyticus]OEG21098.1 hydroxymethylglutaryl-CoA synthase [Enterococcus ureilyticus]